MRAITIAMVAFLVSTNAFAWGREGHAVVADIAAAHLAPQTAARVAELLQNEPQRSLAGIASWADAVREQATKRWHFVNLNNDCTYQPEQNCPHGQCIVQALIDQEQILADANRDATARAVALKWVVHLVGDIGQPLHDIGHGDKGGNRYQVNIYGRGTNLHTIWDADLVRALGPDAAQITASLTPDPGRVVTFARAADFDPAAWAQDACRLVDSRNMYPQGHKIDEQYIATHTTTVAQQLRKSGERLAAVLNLAFAPRTQIHERTRQ